MDAITLLMELEKAHAELEGLETQKEQEKMLVISNADDAVLVGIEKEYQDRLAVLNEWFQKQRSTVITEDVLLKQAEIDKKFFQKNEELNLLIASKEKEVREAVIELGVSVKGTSLHAVYSKGTAKWDNKKLEGFALVHPEVMACREPLVPTVTLRKITKKEE